MEKNLCAVGNSLALIIDYPIRKMLGIGRKTRVKMWTDGRRLVIEPVPGSHVEAPPAPESPALTLNAFATIRALVEEFHMPRDQFPQLHHAKKKMFAYYAWAELGLADTATPEDQATMRRLEACLQALRGGSSMEQAIAHALASVPMP